MTTLSIGTTLPPTQFLVTEGQLSAFAAAIGESEPAALPTLPTCYGLWANPAWIAALRAAGVPLEQLLHGEEEYIYHAPIGPGTSLLAEAQVADLRERSGQSGPITIITLATRFSDSAGALLVEGRTVIVMK
jgi:hypothetical protein